MAPRPLALASTSKAASKGSREATQMPSPAVSVDIRSPSSSEGSNSDRKKATHLRCERQRREAINVDDGERDLIQLESNVTALKQIIKHYEDVTAGTSLVANAPPEAKMLQILLDDVFTSFAEEVDFTNYEYATRTLLTWTETLENNVQSTMDKMSKIPFKKPRR